MRKKDEAGDTLIEIVVALVLIGLVVAAYFATYSTSATGSTTQRDLVTADAALRNYAEAIKTAVRASCNDNATYTPAYVSPDPSFVLSPDPSAPQTCPPVTGPLAQQVPQVDLIVTLPNGSTRTMSMTVRTS
jgi:type II secretory pathway pseudopilin PulG